jgi:hypothetical protein
MSETVADMANQNFAAAPRTVKFHRLEEPASRLDDFASEPQPRGDDDLTAATRLQALNPKLPVEAELPECPRPSNPL